MKRIYIGVVVVLLVFVLGGIFVFGDKTLDPLKQGDFSGEGSISVGEGDVVIGQDDVSVQQGVSDVGGGGGESGGGGSGGEVGCETQQVQYSLGNFVENIECLVYGVGVCDRAKATCGAEVYNLDYEVGGIFGIKFSLFSGDEEISFKVIEEDVGARGRINLRSEIVLDESLDIGSLKCVVDSDTVPRKCIA